MKKYSNKLFLLSIVMLLSVPLYAVAPGNCEIGIINSHYTNFADRSLQVIKRWLDFGEVSGDAPIEATYTLKNNTNSKIEIKSIEPDCVFSGYVVEEYFIKPFEELEIIIILDTSIRGYFKNYIIVEADTEQRFYSLVFEATLK